MRTSHFTPVLAMSGSRNPDWAATWNSQECVNYQRVNYATPNSETSYQTAKAAGEFYALWRNPAARAPKCATNMKNWDPELIKRRPDITMETVDKFLTRMYRTNLDFVFAVTRDFVRAFQTPLLILPDAIPTHPSHTVAMEAAMLVPHAEVGMFP